MNVVLVSGVDANDFSAMLSKLAADATKDPDITQIAVAAGGYDIQIEVFDSTAGKTYKGAEALHLLIKLQMQKGK